MKIVTLFLALSLSIGLMGCGTDPDGTSPSDDGGMTGKMDDPFVERRAMGYPYGPEGSLIMRATVCKTDVYFYESKDGQFINWFGFVNKNDTLTHVYVWDAKTNIAVATGISHPNGKDGSSGGVARGSLLKLDSAKLDPTGRNLLPCETVQATMP